MIGYRRAMGVVRLRCDQMVRRGDAAYQGDPKVFSKNGPTAIISIGPGPDNLIDGYQVEHIDVVDEPTREVRVTAAIEHSGNTVKRVSAIERNRKHMWVANLMDAGWPKTLAGMIETAVASTNPRDGYDGCER